MKTKIGVFFLFLIVMCLVGLFLRNKREVSITPVPTLFPSDIPFPQASSLETLPALYPYVSWQKGSGVLNTTKQQMFKYIYPSYEVWTSEVTKVNENDSLGNADYIPLYNYYNDAFQNMEWYGSADADGPTGAIRGFIGHKGDETREVILEMARTNETGHCGSVCLCPCTSHYTLYISGILKKAEN